MTEETWNGIDRRSSDLLNLTADIVAAHVGNNTVAISDLPQLIANVHGALGDLGGPVPPPPQEPAVSKRSAVRPDSITCLECGQKMKTLRRHIRVKHDLPPAEYLAKWGLPKDYPMTAPNYSVQRKKLALELGLGRAGSKASRHP